MHIALIKTGALGDVVRTTSLLPGLRRGDAVIDLTWITAEEARCLVDGLQDVTRTVAIDDPEDAPWRHARYDWVISLDDGHEECALASSLRAERLSGGYLGPDGRRLYTSDLEPWFGMGILRPAHRGGLDAANALKKTNTKTVATLLYECLGLPLPPGRIRVPLADAHRDAAHRWLSESGPRGTGPLVGVNTGAGGRWRFKSWGEGQTALLARRLHDQHGARVVLLGGEAEAGRNNAISDEAARPGGIVAGPTGMDLLEFAALIEATALLVTSDSLALHLGVAVGRPVVSFFGPTSAEEIEVYGYGEKVVTPLDCRCCYLQDCDIRPHCMQMISVDMLMAAVARWLPVVARGPIADDRRP
jgi:heptosyltransferase-2